MDIDIYTDNVIINHAAPMTMSIPSRFTNHSSPLIASRPFVAQGALDEGWAGTCRLGAIGLWVTGSPFVAWDVAVPFAFDRWLPDPSETFCRSKTVPLFRLKLWDTTFGEAII